MPRKHASKTRQTQGGGVRRTSKGKGLACPNCGRKFAKSRMWQVFCSTACRKAAWLKKNANAAVLADHEARLRAIEARLKIKGAK